MCGPAIKLCLLLWIGGITTVRGEVFAPSSLTAEAGRPLVLVCNITTVEGDAVRQVRWLDRNSQLLLAYEQQAPVRVSHQEPGVNLTASDNGSSSITIEAVRPDDDGACYRCVFDVFPRGAQEGSTCLRVTGKVHMGGNRTAVTGKPLVLSCSYSLPERVRQVLWRKTAERGGATTVASYTKHGHHDVEAKARMDLSRTLGDTQLSINSVRMDDEACYTCEFHTYPDGTRSATACLSVYVLPFPNVTYKTVRSGVTEARCETRSRPAADVTWQLGGENRTLEPPVSSVSQQFDGTTIVTSTVVFPSALLSELVVKCVVEHRGMDTPMMVWVSDIYIIPWTPILWSLGGVIVILLLCMCAYLSIYICTKGCFHGRSRPWSRCAGQVSEWRRWSVWISPG